MLPWKGASFWKENQFEFGRGLFQRVSLLWLLEDCSWGMAIGHFLANYSCMETPWPVFASYSLKAQSVHIRVGCGWFLGFLGAERGVKDICTDCSTTTYGYPSKNSRRGENHTEINKKGFCKVSNTILSTHQNNNNNNNNNPKQNGQWWIRHFLSCAVPASPHRRLRKSSWSRSGDSFGWTSDVSTLHTSCLDHE